MSGATVMMVMMPPPLRGAAVALVMAVLNWCGGDYLVCDCLDSTTAVSRWCHDGAA